MKQMRFKHFIGFSVCALMLVLCLPKVLAQSESSILFVAPSRVVVPPKENIAVVNVSNRSSEARRYDITVVDQVMTEEGMTRRVETFDYSAKRFLRFQPKRFTLEPGQRQVIRIMAKRPQDIAAGDYHSHILFREVPLSLVDKKQVEKQATDGKTQFEIKTLYGVAIPVIIQNGEVISDLNLGELSYVPAADGSPAHIAVELQRSGNAEASAILRVKFHREGAEPVALNGEQWVAVYREVDKVTRRIPLTALSEGQSLKGGKVVVELVKGAVTPQNVGKPETVAGAENISVVTKEISF